jgi:vacuolar-type H+-ATPase subunit I/STV1
MFIYSLAAVRSSWRLYAKSFLGFGYLTMLQSHLTASVNDAMKIIVPGSAQVPFYLDYCYFAGYAAYAASDKYPGVHVRLTGPPIPAQDQFDRCLAVVGPLLFAYDNSYCREVYGDEYCSINGAYQPRLTSNFSGNSFQFFGTSSFVLVWKILLLPETASLIEYHDNAEKLCSMTFSQVIDYYDSHNFFSDPDEELSVELPNYCYLVSYVYLLLTDGFRFPPDAVITVSPAINDRTVTWTVGAIMHEINEFPWTLESTGSHTTSLHRLMSGSLVRLSVAFSALALCK